MEEQKRSFVFYRSFYEAIKTMPSKNKLNLYEAICNYALNENENDSLIGVEQTVFTLIKPQLDANQKRYENGSKGGRPITKNKPKANLNKIKAKPNVNDNVNVNDNENIHTCSNEQECERLFEQFWKAYPKKQAKEQARKTFNKINLNEELLNKILSAVEQRKNKEEWQKDNGRYIPLASTYLNGRRWEDEEENMNISNQRKNNLDFL